MVELFVNPKIDWIAAKKYFIGLTILLLVAGAISVSVRGFNLGVDFTGGTIMTLRFKEPHSASSIRSILSKTMDTSKVTIQNDTSHPTDVIIRAPVLGNEAEKRVDQTKREIVRALQQLNSGNADAVGRVNLNTLTADGVQEELELADPLSINKRTFAGPNPYGQIASQIIAFRDSQEKGFLTNISQLDPIQFTLKGLPDYSLDAAAQSKIKDELKKLFYAGKIDLNLTSEGEIASALQTIDPLKIGAQSGASDTYAKKATEIVNTRTASNGILKSLSSIDEPELVQKMDPYFTAGDWAVISANIVGPQVGKDLRDRAIYVTLAALAGMLVYIAFRFEWIYGVAAVLAVFHDVMITLGVFSLLKQEISLTVVAALLTLVGYSMNDTIVVFDRIRENLRLRRRDNLVQITNDSINQTLSRTIIAAGLTFLSVLSILIFGGQVLRGFALALTIGILIGTYSSIAVASPIMMWWQYLIGGKSGHGRGGVRVKQAERSLAKV